MGNMLLYVHKIDYATNLQVHISVQFFPVRMCQSKA